MQLLPQGGSSFPSGHTICAMAVYGMLIVLLLTYWKPGARRTAYMILCGAAVAAVGFSRIYLGVHYTTDVLGGLTAGVVMIILALWIMERIRARF